MRKLIKPNIKTEEIYSKCSRKFRDRSLVQRLLSCENSIIETSNRFDELAELHKTYRMIESLADNGVVTSKELRKIYTDKMATKGSIGREDYDRILTIPKNNICPLCGTRVVSTLDHYLPKSKYPSLSVTPNNLIAACRDCNVAKSDTVFVSNYDETLHPYYDNIEKHRWLFCEVIESSPISFKYSIEMIDTADDLLFRRTKNHFETFKLGELYSVKAAEMISGIEYMLKRLYKSSGKKAVLKQIQEDMQSREQIAINSWEAAFYRGILKSEWFIDKWIIL